jgi:hypothetical protein
MSTIDTLTFSLQATNGPVAGLVGLDDELPAGGFRGDTTNIWIMNSDGGGKAPLTTCQIDSRQPAQLATCGSVWRSRRTRARGQSVTLRCSPGSTPTPTTSPSSGRIQGDVDCSGVVDAADFRLPLKFAAGSSSGIASAGWLRLAADLVGGFPWGDVNCDHAVDGADVLYVLAHAVGIELHQPQGCAGLGHSIS